LKVFKWIIISIYMVLIFALMLRSYDEDISNEEIAEYLITIIILALPIIYMIGE